MDDHEQRVDVTDEDVRTARRLWLAALNDPWVPAEQTTELHEGLRRLMHTQAQQVAQEFRAGQRASHQAAADELRAARRAVPEE